jgi:hypothetical protein
MMTREIPLTQGRVALVDDQDYEWLNQTKWRYCEDEPRPGYARGHLRGTGVHIRMHRLILDAPPDMQVDHINGNTLDNRRVNLRLASQVQNSRNAQPHRHARSPYKGVSWQPTHRKWRAMICINGTLKHLGYFANEVDAAHAYDNAARSMFGEFARTNFTQE